MKVIKILTYFFLFLSTSSNLNSHWFEWLSILSFSYTSQQPSLDELVNQAIDNYEKHTPNSRNIRDKIRNEETQRAYIDNLLEATIALQNKEADNQKIIKKATEEANKAHEMSYTKILRNTAIINQQKEMQKKANEKRAMANEQEFTKKVQTCNKLYNLLNKYNEYNPQIQVVKNPIQSKYGSLCYDNNFFEHNYSNQENHIPGNGPIVPYFNFSKGR